MLVVVMCMTSVAKAQFYDSADDIYYYVAVKDDGNLGGMCFIFNFDGKNACILAETDEDDDRYPPLVDEVKTKISQNTNFLENRIETGLYDVKFMSGNTYKKTGNYDFHDENVGYHYGQFSWTFRFTNDREFMYWTLWNNNQGGFERTQKEWKFKRVDKSYFRVGRSRTPSGTLHE